MNLINIAPLYSKADHAIILFESCLHLATFGRRIIHQEVMDALVQYMEHEQPPFCEQRINSHGQNYVLSMTPCK